jgi:predicted NBD/HSP70 family sugar kinase
VTGSERVLDSVPWLPGRTPSVTQEEVRRHNLGVLLRLLHVRGATARADLTAVTGLNRSTVRALTTELAEAGLVRESAPVGRGGAGRPSILVEPRSEQVWALAVDIGVEHVTAARIGLGGVLLDRVESRQPRGDTDVQAVLDRLRTLVEPLLAGRASPVGIGVAVPGMVGGPDDLVRFAPNMGWIDVPLGRLVAAALGGPPVSVGNEGDLGVMAEHLRGVAADAADVVYLTGEVGLGGGIIVGGRPLTGAGGYAGEVGHMSVNPDGGRLCTCGRRGCWETEVGADAVLLASGVPAGSPPADVLRALVTGDRATRSAARRVGRWLGVGVANLVNLFNPEVVVFGGLTRLLFPVLEPYVRAELSTSLTAPRDQVRLALPALGADSSLVGAAELAFAPLLGDPLGAR